ncbi:uncharacterized protein [Onthophagus taurus]|uniref:uncharacterized protein isoform X2 n=1 Tax=Onthophagus taurus TaxID=166361 RepID=UPI0039BE6001
MDDEESPRNDEHPPAVPPENEEVILREIEELLLDDIQANKDNNDDSADERLGESYERANERLTFPRKYKMKFPYTKTSIISSISCSGELSKSTNQKSVIKRRIYITSCHVKEQCNKKLSLVSLEPHLSPIAKGKIELKETNCGLLLTFYDEDDFNKMLRMSLSKIFNTPIAVWNIPHINSRVNNTIIIRDIPWCVKTKEIEDVLNVYGVCPLYSTRNEDGSIKVVVKNPFSLNKLLRDGLNFYNSIILPVSLEPSPNPDIIQCYRCQRFWHTAQFCPFSERCVRCGDKHDFRMCTRDRNDPNCCLCGDAHHAAYKYCPVRIQHLNTVQVDVNLERE